MFLSWMSWTWQTATFFICIAFMLFAMGVWEYLVPGGSPRQGILGIETTRGDRLFISLLGSAFIHLAWLGISDFSLWIATVLSTIYLLLVFKFV